jgi:flagellar basal-body rod protein FlgF
MHKGIYIAASGAILKQTQLEVVSQNLANVNTTGYKRDGISFKEHLVAQQSALPDGRSMGELSEHKTDLSSGTIIRTGNSFDVAIDGNGLIALEGGRYARRGDLKKDREGYLTTHNGTKVLGSGGPIRLPDGPVDIDAQGKISVMETGSTTATELDTIRVEDFGPEAGLTKTGDGQFVASGPGSKSSSGVKQGYIEMSNVDTVKEMVHMIETLREFESYQKVIQTFDDSIANVNNNLGRL